VVTTKIVRHFIEQILKILRIVGH